MPTAKETIKYIEEILGRGDTPGYIPVRVEADETREILALVRTMAEECDVLRERNSDGKTAFQTICRLRAELIVKKNHEKRIISGLLLIRKNLLKIQNRIEEIENRVRYIRMVRGNDKP